MLPTVLSPVAPGLPAVDLHHPPGHEWQQARRPGTLTRMLVPRENRIFVTDPLPYLVVVAPPHMAALPPLTLQDGAVAWCEGWQLLARLTLTVVDGPGEAGFMVPGAHDQAEVTHLDSWLDAVEAADGAVVIALDSPQADISLEALVAHPSARGGAVPFVPPE